MTSLPSQAPDWKTNASNDKCVKFGRSRTWAPQLILLAGIGIKWLRDFQQVALSQTSLIDKIISKFGRTTADPVLCGAGSLIEEFRSSPSQYQIPLPAMVSSSPLSQQKPSGYNFGWVFRGCLEDCRSGKGTKVWVPSSSCPLSTAEIGVLGLQSGGSRDRRRSAALAHLTRFGKSGGSCVESVCVKKSTISPTIRTSRMLHRHLLVEMFHFVLVVWVMPIWYHI